MKASPLWIVGIILIMAFGSPVHAAGNVIQCQLEKQGTGEYQGACEVPCLVVSWAIGVHGPLPAKTCVFPAKRANVMLQPTDQGRGWRGTMVGKFAEDPTLLELIEGQDGNPGVAKTPFGWFALKSVNVSGKDLGVVIDGNNLLPATQNDFAILHAAMALVSSEATWNRHDTRKCPEDAKTWSIFCALEKATKDVEGSVHYRQPALQAVREIVDEIGGDRTGKHRLMDYNNNPATTIGEVRKVLELAESRLRTDFQ